MAILTGNKLRGAQLITGQGISVALPNTDGAGGFDSSAEFAIVAGVYPIFAGVAGPAAVIKGMLIMLPGRFIGGIAALIIPEEPF